MYGIEKVYKYQKNEYQKKKYCLWSVLGAPPCSHNPSDVFFFKRFAFHRASLLQHPVSIYFLKINNKNTRARCEICSTLIVKTPERHQWRRSGVFIVNFEHISHLVSVFIVNFEQADAGWTISLTL